MAHTHDLVDPAIRGLRPCGDLEAIGATGPLDHQRVVARGCERIGEATEHAGTRVMDRGGLAVHHLPRALVRAPMSGFLLRVESAVLPGEQLDAAEARARGLLRALAVKAQEAVR